MHFLWNKVNLNSLLKGIYILLSGFGAFTIHQFVGDEMYGLLLPDDPSKWPLHAYLTLPLLPISLLSGQTKRYQNLIPITSLILSWPSLPPVNQSPIVNSFLSFLPFLGAQNNAPQLYGSIKELESATLWDIFFSWPPSPFMLSIIISATRRVYQILLIKLRRRVLGAGHDGTNANAVGGDEDWRVELRLRNADDQAGAAPDAQAEQDLEANMDGAADAEELRPLARDDAQVVVQVDGVIEVNGVPVEGVDDAARPPAAPADNAPAPANPAGPPPRRNEDRNLMLLTGGVLGRLLGGALIIPPAASLMGSLLLRLALPSVKNAHRRINSFAAPKRFSPRYLLQKFLAIRPPGSAMVKPFAYLNADLRKLSPLQMMRYSIAVCNRSMFVGSPAWTTADPVWYVVTTWRIG